MSWSGGGGPTYKKSCVRMDMMGMMYPFWRWLKPGLWCGTPSCIHSFDPTTSSLAIIHLHNKVGKCKVHLSFHQFYIILRCNTLLQGVPTWMPRRNRANKEKRGQPDSMIPATWHLCTTSLTSPRSVSPFSCKMPRCYTFQG